MDGLSLDLPEAPQAPSAEMAFEMPSPAESTAPAPLDAVTRDDGLLNFDLGSLSLELDGPKTAPAPVSAEPDAAEDPLETKLALADEFVSIGDNDGARALIEEVIAEATGELRTKAEQALAKLS
jgi:pilus assembly protein FimV